MDTMKELPQLLEAALQKVVDEFREEYSRLDDYAETSFLQAQSIAFHACEEDIDRRLHDIAEEAEAKGENYD